MSGRRNSTWRAGIVAVVSILLGACTEAPTPPPPISRLPPDRAVQEDEIREAVFRYRIKTRYSEFSQTPSFLSIDGKDPSDEFMARFAGSNPPVKKGSGAYVKENPFEDRGGDPNQRTPLEGMLRDRSNDKGAFALHVGRITWITPTRAEVQGGTYCGWLCGDGGIFRAVKKNVNWMVESYEQRVIF